MSDQESEAEQPESARTPEKKPAKAQGLRRNDVIAIGASLVIAAGMFVGASRIGAVQETWLVNGLDAPVDVEVDGVKTQVGPGGKASARLAAGVHQIRALAPTGEPFDQGPFDVPGGFTGIVYNVIGAAPVYFVNVTYSNAPTAGADVDFQGGSRALYRRDVDHVFTELPKSITVKSGESRSRSKIDMGPGGWLSTVHYLDEKGRHAQAAEIARAVARAQPGDLRALAYARHFTELSQGPEGAIRFLRGEITRRPDDLEAHLSYIGTMQRAGRSDAVRAEYVKRYESTPGAPYAAGLMLWAESLERGAVLAKQLLASHPEDVLIHEGAGRIAIAQGDWVAAVEHFARLKGGPHYARRVDDHARALAATGQVPEALAVVASFASIEAQLDVPTALLYAQLARISGAQKLPVPARAFAQQIAAKGGPTMLPWINSLLDSKVDLLPAAAGENTKDLKATLEIHVAAGTDPSRAWDLCSTASLVTLDKLHSTVALLLAAEFARAGDRELAERMLGSRLEYGYPAKALLAYALDGVEPADFWHLDIEWRAALDLVRARRLDERGLNSDAMYAAATRRDVLQTAVTVASTAWVSLAKGPVGGLGLKKSGSSPTKGGVVGGLVLGSTSTPSKVRPGVGEVVLKREPSGS